MTTTQDLQSMQGQTALDVNGDKLGKIGQIYLDDQTSQPLWVTIATGTFGTKESFAVVRVERHHGRPAAGRDQGHGQGRPGRRRRRAHR
jgi:PRC-barrel domain